MTAEYLLYGLERDATERWTEVLLGTASATERGAARLDAIESLARADGYHSFRRATFSGSAPQFGRNVLAR